MIYNEVVLLILIVLQQSFIVGADDPESLWSSEQGNSQNTHRIVPSMPVSYSKTSWIYEYNLTSQDTTEFGQGAGINGDLYFFLGKTRYHRGKFFFYYEIQFK